MSEVRLSRETLETWEWTLRYPEDETARAQLRERLQADLSASEGPQAEVAAEPQAAPLAPFGARLHWSFGKERVLVSTGLKIAEDDEWVLWRDESGRRVGMALRSAWDKWPVADWSPIPSAPEGPQAEPAPAPEGECPHFPGPEERYSIQKAVCKLSGHTCPYYIGPEDSLAWCRRLCRLRVVAAERDRLREWAEKAEQSLAAWTENSDSWQKACESKEAALSACRLKSSRRKRALRDLQKALTDERNQSEKDAAGVLALLEKVAEMESAWDNAESRVSELETALAEATQRAEAAEAQARGCFRLEWDCDLHSPAECQRNVLELARRYGEHPCLKGGTLIMQALKDGPSGGPGWWVSAEKVRGLRVEGSLGHLERYRQTAMQTLRALGIPPEALKPETKEAPDGQA